MDKVRSYVAKLPNFKFKCERQALVIRLSHLPRLEQKNRCRVRVKLRRYSIKPKKLNSLTTVLFQTAGKGESFAGALAWS